MNLSFEEAGVVLNALKTCTHNHMAFNQVSPEVAALIMKLEDSLAMSEAVDAIVEEAPAEEVVEAPAEEAPAE